MARITAPARRSVRAPATTGEAHAPRRIAAVTAMAVLAAPAAAHAAAHQGTHGPSATPLIVELAAAALIATLA